VLHVAAVGRFLHSLRMHGKSPGVLPLSSGRPLVARRTLGWAGCALQGTAQELGPPCLLGPRGESATKWKQLVGKSIRLYVRQATNADSTDAQQA